MNFITAVKSGGKVAAALILALLMASMPSQARAQVAFQLFGDYAHNNRPWQITTGHFQNNNRLGIEMVTELYDSGYRFDHFGDFYYINSAGAGYNGIQGRRGIAVADLDKDGIDDSIYISENSLSVRYHNLDKNAYFYAEGAQLVAVADVDMDGWKDIVVVKSNGEILTYINNRITPYTDSNGGFHSNFSGVYYKTDFPEEFIKPGAQAIATGLIDNNGRWGLAIANADGHVYVYLPYNGGDADEFYWSLVETKEVGVNFTSSNPMGIAIGDVDGDGALDIVTANTGDSTISVLTGLGYGPFRDAVTYNTGIAPICVAIGDCNNDGIKDVFVGNSGDNHLSYYLGTGLQFAPLGQERTYDVAGFTYAIAAGDINQDGKLDLIFGAIDGAGLGIGYGDGVGNFNNPSEQSIFQGSIPLTADLDGDGDLDVVALNSSDSFAVFRNDGGVLTKVGQYFFGGLAPNDAPCLALEDVDGDGKKDIVGTGFYRNLEVFKNLGGLNFSERMHYDLNINSARFKMIDLNGDNKKDIVLVDPGDTHIELRYNDGAGGFAASTLLTGAGDPHGLATGDLDGDGKADLVVSDRDNNRLTIWKGVGNSFTFLGYFAIGTKPRSVQLVDLNGDNKLDVIVTTISPVNDDNDGSNDTNSDRISVALGNGNGTFGAVSHYNSGRNTVWTQTADLNYDGFLDIIGTGAWGWNVTTLQGVGNGTFVHSTELLNGVPGAGIFTLGDMDGDSLLDIVVGSTYHSRFRVYQNVTQVMTVTGTIQIQGRSPGGIQPTFEFRRNGTDETFTRKATLNNAGVFTMTRVLAGDYTVHVKVPTGLAQNIGVSGGQGSVVNIGTLTFLNGDATGDNAVDISDLLLLISHYNQRKNTPANNPLYLASVDLNNDSSDDISDLLIIIGNYNRRGDQ